MRRRLHKTFETLIGSVVGALEAREAVITAMCHREWVAAGLPIYEDDGIEAAMRRSTSKEYLGVREAVLEEAAHVADKFATGGMGIVGVRGRDVAYVAAEIAERIRILKEKA